MQPRLIRTGAALSLAVADAIAALASVKAVMDFNQWVGIQRMGIACLQLPRQRLRDDAAAWRTRAAALSEGLQKHAGWSIPLPRSCMYLWAPLPASLHGIVDDLQFAEELVRRKGVALNPGRAFGPGGAGYVRFALVAPEEVLRDDVAVRVGQLVAELVAESSARSGA
jgi:aspartate/methionine/tyrosine aminotransferase